MKIIIQKSTGALIEMQSLAKEGDLLKNAINAGYDKDDIEEKDISSEEFKVLLNAQPSSSKKTIIDLLIESDEELHKLKSALEKIK